MIIERKAAKKASNEIEQSQRASTSKSRPKKKRKVARNEIDDIFGFEHYCVVHKYSIELYYGGHMIISAEGRHLRSANIKLHLYSVTV